MMLEKSCYVLSDEYKNYEKIILIQLAGDIAQIRYHAIRVSDQKDLWVSTFVSSESLSFVAPPDDLSKEVTLLNEHDIYGTGEIKKKKNMFDI